MAVLCLLLLGLRPAPCKGSSGGTVLAFQVYVLGVPVSTGTTFLHIRSFLDTVQYGRNGPLK